MPLTTTFRAGSLSYTNVTASDASGSTADNLTGLALSQIYNNGTGANQADQACRDYRTLATASQTYTLSALPNSQALAKCKLLCVVVDPASTGTMVIATGATHGWAGVTVGKPLVAGSILLITWPTVAGAAVGVGATDQITFTATGSVTYTAVFIGTSA